MPHPGKPVDPSSLRWSVDNQGENAREYSRVAADFLAAIDNWGLVSDLVSIADQPTDPVTHSLPSARFAIRTRLGICTRARCHG
jgi:hypothetical protein